MAEIALERFHSHVGTFRRTKGDPATGIASDCAACSPATSGTTTSTGGTRAAANCHRTTTPDKVIDLTARIQRRKVLDGLINEYYRGA